MALISEQASVTSDTAQLTAPAGTGSVWGFAALCLLAAGGLGVLVEMRNSAQFWTEITTGQAALHLAIAKLGVWAPVAFTALFASLMLLIWVPATPVLLLAGFLFGPVGGAVYSLLATTIGAVAVFLLARVGLAPRVTLRGPFLRKIEAGFQSDALLYVIALRIMPVIPFGPIHVAAALLPVPFGIFTLGTVIGMVPIVIVYAYLGDNLGRVAARGRDVDVGSVMTANFLLPLIGLTLLMLVPVVVRNLRAR